MSAATVTKLPVAETGRIVVEKGVPIPGRANGKAKYPWREMEIGDSFFAAGFTTSSFTQTAYARKITGFSFTHRTVEGGVRVWRTA